MALNKEKSQGTEQLKLSPERKAQVSALYKEFLARIREEADEDLPNRRSKDSDDTDVIDVLPGTCGCTCASCRNDHHTCGFARCKK